MRITRSEAGTFFVASIAVSAAIWRLAFNLGAYDTVFAEHLMLIWVVSVAALMANFVIGRLDEGRQYLPLWGVVILFVPSLWAASEFFFFGDDRAISAVAYWTLTTLMLVPTTPYVGYLILTVAVPQALQIKRLRFLFGLVLVSCSIAAAGYFAGVNNDVFLYCRDFDVAGDWRPENCFDDAKNAAESQKDAAD